MVLLEQPLPNAPDGGNVPTTSGEPSRQVDRPGVTPASSEIANSSSAPLETGSPVVNNQSLSERKNTPAEGSKVVDNQSRSGRTTTLAEDSGSQIENDQSTSERNNIPAEGVGYRHHHQTQWTIAFTSKTASKGRHLFILTCLPDSRRSDQATSEKKKPPE
eukprot:CAMPEP_0167808672 /NCGR_PEP_ID=MMETSP0111_2-20121227/23335_1 /TAXON_ID=91324 /ORGANISM="Lotharella globosa, Strain CCCM811" /LENGTH=160 /DNA_ID=CAMNT_0007706905 /DNA_START=227 /DNA_END=709 /DNA_ORIENTATION=+